MAAWDWSRIGDKMDSLDVRLMMTSFGRLRIVKQLDDGETQSYAVFDPNRGKEILLHVLPGERTAENRVLWERLDKGLDTARKIILERGDLLGVKYVVTEYPPQFDTLIQQLEDFTRESQEAVRPAEVATPPVTPPAEPAVGEFTRLFKSPSAPEPPQSAEGPGEFTRMFQMTPPPPDRAPPPKPRSRTNAGNGEFTRYFQDPLGKGSGEVDFGRNVPAPPPKAEAEPGEFTRMFGRPSFSGETKPPKPVEQVVEPSDETGGFSAGRRTPSRRLPQSSPQSQGPSEFTRVVKSAGPPKPVAPEAGQGQQEIAAQQAAKPTILFAVLGFLLVLAIALVLYFALKH
jgi:hypothetical protein